MRRSDHLVVDRETSRYGKDVFVLSTVNSLNPLKYISKIPAVMNSDQTTYIHSKFTHTEVTIISVVSARAVISI